jgi:uncharacterized protein (TIGR03437 family)
MIKPFVLRCLPVLGVMSSVLVPAWSQPTVTSVVNAASFDTAVPRGCLISIFGTNLARATASATSIPLPTKIEDASVLVGDLELPAPLYYVSSTQINAQLPFEALGAPLALVVSTSAGRSKPFLINPAAAGPGLFTRDSSITGPALAFTPGFQPLDAITSGQPMILYATGLGPTDPPVLSGNPGAGQEPLNRVTTLPAVYAGEYPLPVPISFAGLAPGLVGVYQINVTPQWLASDRLFLQAGGKTSNTVKLPLMPGNNVTNATGTLQVIYPTSQGVVTFSPHLIEVQFTARMDISATAGPFAIAAVTEGMPSSVIAIDPEKGTYDGYASEPTRASRAFDFSSVPEIRYDLVTCQSGPGGPMPIPFPGNVLPLSRVSPQEVQALNALPLPNVDIPASATGLLHVQGQATRGSTFVIDGSTNSNLSLFAGYIPVHTLCAPSQTTTVRLLIDGRQVASVDVNYTTGFVPPPGGPQ